MDHDGWHKSMAHFSTKCVSSPLNPQVLFYCGHYSHFGDWVLDIICRHNIQSFILRAGDYLNDQEKYNIPNTKFKNFYGNARMTLMRHHGTLNFSTPHMNSILVETWEIFKLSYITTTQKYFNKTHTPPPPPSNKSCHKQQSFSCRYSTVKQR